MYRPAKVQDGSGILIVKGRLAIQTTKEIDMKKFLAAAGVASLLVAVVPLAAQAAPHDHAQQSQRSNSDYRVNDNRSTHRDHVEHRAEDRQRDVRRHREVRRERIERRRAVERWNRRFERRYVQAERHHERAVARHFRHREFRHWRRGLERAHYRNFSAPVYYDGYYQVRAHDRDNRAVFLMISALTGAIIASSY